jgi:hypothetical protein
MTKRTPLPPELGGKLPKAEYERLAHNEMRRDLVRDVSKVLGSTATPKPAQAEILRKMADQIEKSDERAGPVARTQQRLAAQRVTRFFGREVAPPKPESMAAYWLEQKEKAERVQPMQHFRKDREQERDR